MTDPKLATAPKVKTTPPMITVTIRDRRHEPAWGSGLTRPCIRHVQILRDCPLDDMPRGARRSMHQSDDGEHYYVHTWSNPCGHVDHYLLVSLEAELLNGDPTPERVRDVRTMRRVARLLGDGQPHSLREMGERLSIRHAQIKRWMTALRAEEVTVDGEAHYRKTSFLV